MKKYRNLFMLSALCLTLGLAPFNPEPHVWQKMKWVANGGEGMAWMDWFDLLLHTFPWLLLLLFLLKSSRRKKA